MAKIVNVGTYVPWGDERDGYIPPRIHVDGVTLSPSGGPALDVELGVPLVITATLSPATATDQRVEWSLGGIGASRVQMSTDGLKCTITGNSQWVFTVTCTTVDGRKSATQAYQFRHAATSLSLSPTSVTLAPSTSEIGETEAEIAVNISPTDAPWKASSSGPIRISEQSNSVRVRSTESLGTGTITVTSRIGTPLTATATVEVEDPTVPVTDVTVTPATTTLETGTSATQTSATLTATIAPANATNKSVTWSASPSGRVTLTPNGLSCTVTAVSAGACTVTCTTADGNKTDTCAVTVEDVTPQMVEFVSDSVVSDNLMDCLGAWTTNGDGDSFWARADLWTGTLCETVTAKNIYPSGNSSEERVYASSLNRTNGSCSYSGSSYSTTYISSYTLNPGAASTCLQEFNILSFTPSGTFTSEQYDSFYEALTANCTRGNTCTDDRSKLKSYRLIKVRTPNNETPTTSVTRAGGASYKTTGECRPMPTAYYTATDTDGTPIKLYYFYARASSVDMTLTITVGSEKKTVTYTASNDTYTIS